MNTSKPIGPTTATAALTIGLPTKDGIRKPMFEYEKMLYKALLEPGYLNSGPGSRDSNNQRAAYNFKVKHLWVKKATGLVV